MSALARTGGGGCTIIGVAGGSASGKTTLVNALVEALGHGRTGLLGHDWYYLDRGHLSAGRRAQLNYDHPRALETRLLARHLRALRRGRAIAVPIYDFVTHTRSRRRRVIAPKPIVIVEGLLVLQDRELRGLLDLKVFVDCPEELRLARRLGRDTHERGRSRESVLAQWERTVAPMHRRFVDPSKRHADIVVLGRNRADLRRAAKQVRARLSLLGVE